MRAISLWQPWASLIAVGLKQYETRSWTTAYRGLLAIHAAKKWDADNQSSARYIASESPICREYLVSRSGTLKHLPLGAIVCICNLIDVLPTTHANATQLEEALGNWSPGRFAWKLEVIEVFDLPISARGAQGLFSWERP